MVTILFYKLYIEHDRKRIARKPKMPQACFCRGFPALVEKKKFCYKRKMIRDNISPSEEPKKLLRATLKSWLAAGVSGPEAGEPRGLGEKDAESALRAWFDPLILKKEEEKLSVFFPHAYFVSWFHFQGRELVEKAALQIWGRILFDYRIFPPVPASPPAPSSFSRTDRVPRTDGTENLSPLNPGSANLPDFDSFLPGAKNEHSFRLLRAMGEGLQFWSPLLLKGPPGSGKTHLLRALASSLARLPSHSTVFCLAAADFASFFRQNPWEQDRARIALRSCSAFCLDDIQAISGDARAQEALADLLDALADQKKIAACAISAASDAVAAEILEKFSPSLFSRLNSGVILALAESDLDVRIRYVQKKLAEAGFPAKQPAVLQLARQCSDIRQLQGALQRMAAFSDPNARLPDNANPDAFALSPSSSPPFTSETVLAAVAARYGFTPKDLRGKKRTSRLVQARQIAMYLCRELLGESYPSLGRIFGGKDHSTVIYAVKKIQQTRLANKDMHILVTELTKSCRKRLP
jgi:chromosomal replication initiator protein